MKINMHIHFGKIKDLAKRTFTVFLSLAVLLSSYTSIFAASAYAADSSSTGYSWQRVYSMTELQNAMTAATGHTSFSQLDRSASSDADWTRVMFVWKSGNNYYFSAKRNGDESWNCQRVLATYGIEPEQDTFVTRTGLDTPFMKPSTDHTKYGPDSKYGAVQFAIRFNEEGTENLSKYLLAYQMNFYGIAYHAASKGEFALCAETGNFMAGKGKCAWASSRDRYLTTNIVMSEKWENFFHTNYPDSSNVITKQQANSLLSAYCHTDNGHSWWAYASFALGLGAGILAMVLEDTSTTTQEKIDWAKKNCTGSDYDNSIFDTLYKDKNYPNGLSGASAFNQIYSVMCKNYLTPYRSSADGTAWCFYDFDGWANNRYWQAQGSEMHTTQDEDDKTEFYIFVGTPTETAECTTDRVLTEAVTIFQFPMTIETGVKVTVPKGCTLIIQEFVYNNGTINVDGGTLIVQGILDSDSGSPGSVTLSNNGQIQILESGVMLARAAEQKLIIDEGSSVDVQGTLCMPIIAVKNYSSLTVHQNALLISGGYANMTIDASERLTSKYLYNYKDTYFNSMFEQSSDQTTQINSGTSIADENYHGISVRNNSAFESSGAVVSVCMAARYDSNCSLHYYNLAGRYNTVGNAMEYWDSNNLE